MKKLAWALLSVAVLAVPAYAEYPLEQPEDPVRALFLYHLAGAEFGRRTVWHPQANLFEALIIDGTLALLGQDMRDTYRPTAEQLAEIAALAEDELLLEVHRDPVRVDRAIVRAAFRNDGHDDAPIIFAVALRGNEWRIVAVVDQDDPDPRAIFAPLDTPD